MLAAVNKFNSTRTPANELDLLFLAASELVLRDNTKKAEVVGP
jgi:hypothetical protein